MDRGTYVVMRQTAYFPKNVISGRADISNERCQLWKAKMTENKGIFLVFVLLAPVSLPHIYPNTISHIFCPPNYVESVDNFVPFLDRFGKEEEGGK